MLLVQAEEEVGGTTKDKKVSKRKREQVWCWKEDSRTQITEAGLNSVHHVDKGTEPCEDYQVNYVTLPLLLVCQVACVPHAVFLLLKC